MKNVSNRLIWEISSKMWDSGTNCQNVGQMWDKIAKCGKCGNVGRLDGLSKTIPMSLTLLAFISQISFVKVHKNEK